MTERFTLHNADCLEVLKSLSANSVDSIVTDPPAGISFMGKEWDHHKGGRAEWIAWMTQVAAECLRVIKPGGHALVWAIPRTSHWTATAWEDAGWEVRDRVAHIFGSGFPKSLDVSKAIDKRRIEDHESVRAVAKTLRDALQASGRTRKEIDDHFGTANVSQYWFNPNRNSQVPPAEKWPWLREFLSIGDELDAEVRRLNDRKGQAGEAWGRREVIGQAVRGQAGFSPDLAPRPWKQMIGVEYDLTAPATEAAKQWNGWGTALKPAMEDWWLLRKPLDGTVAQNVQTHGTGALNIEGCRIEMTDSPVYSTAGAAKIGTGRAYRGSKGEYLGSDTPSAGSIRHHAMGRWPANVIHDGSEEVLAAFPLSNGQQGAVTGLEPSSKTNNIYGQFDGRPATRPRCDSGSAARFFYCAKASKRDRDDGLDDHAEKPAGVKNESGLGFSEGDPYMEVRRKNHHPTVKPTELMRYLCRLVTPPGGTVLDPFLGSGSTGKAALLEGFRFIGIEREVEYFEIAKARIEHAQRQPKQTDLFGGSAA